MPAAPAPRGMSAAVPASRRTLTIASLFAAVAAAFAGMFLYLTSAILWDAFAHSDASGLGYMMVPVGTFFLSLFGFWIALPLTLPPALLIAHLSPSLERLLAPADLLWVQYGSGAGAGFSVMLALGFLVQGGEDIVIASLAGMLAGLVAVRTFRRFVYAA